jgi:hypothetical protein
MEVEVIEKYDKLRDLRPGQMAVSKDRQKVFACAHVMIRGNPMPQVFELTDLRSQYPDKIDKEQPVRVLGEGERILITG